MKINEKVRALSAYRSLAWKFSSSLLIIHLLSFTVKWLYTMQLPQAPGEQKHFHQVTEENVRGPMTSTGPIILSIAQKDEKSNCSDSGMYTSNSMLRTWRKKWTRQPPSQSPFYCLLRDEERLGKVWTTKLALVGKLACPPFPYCKLQMLFTVRRRWQN